MRLRFMEFLRLLYTLRFTFYINSANGLGSQFIIAHTKKIPRLNNICMLIGRWYRQAELTSLSLDAIKPEGRSFETANSTVSMEDIRNRLKRDILPLFGPA